MDREEMSYGTDSQRNKVSQAENFEIKAKLEREEAKKRLLGETPPKTREQERLTASDSFPRLKSPKKCKQMEKSEWINYRASMHLQKHVYYDKKMR